MKLSKDDVKKLAQLARLKLTNEEIEMYTTDLTNILDYVELLKECDTEGLVETSQVTGLSNVTREDEIDMELCSPDELLETSHLPIVDRQIRIKRMM